VVLQLLYQTDQNPQVEPEMVQQFLERRLRDADLEQFARCLYDGTLTHRGAIDQKLAAVAENWSVERMAAVDRNILRLGAFELLHQPETPLRVVIDEAVELAKRYGSAESPAFVNGLLDRLASTRDQESRKD
jgi:N utilization substance protein B